MSDSKIPDVRGTGYSKEDKWIHDREKEQAERRKKEQAEKGNENHGDCGCGDEKPTSNSGKGA